MALYDTTAHPFTSAAATGWLDGGAAPGLTSSTTKGQGVTAQGSTDEYWLPIWSGEILTAYDQYNIFEPLVTTRAITSGTTMRFPITGTVSHKAVWGAGEELADSVAIDAPQYFDISLDQRPMASYFELDDIALMMTQWEYRSEIARQAGLSLANARDKQIACLIAQGAFMDSRSPSVAKGGNMANSSVARSAIGTVQNNCYGSSTTFDMPAHTEFNALGETTATDANRTKAALKLLEYIERYMVRLQEIDGPTEGVYVALTPQAFNDIRALGVARSGDAQSIITNMQPMFGGVAAAGGLGAGYTTGLNALSDSLEYMGATIIKTNHMPRQTVQYSAAAADWADADAPTDTVTIDDDLLNILFDASTSDASGATPIGGTPADSGTGLQLRKIHDLGDAKYDFDWVNFGNNADSGANVGGNCMHPVKALMWQRDDVASLSLQGLKVDSIQDVRRNTQFTVASVMRGGGVLRPELCAAILAESALVACP